MKLTVLTSSIFLFGAFINVSAQDPSIGQFGQFGAYLSGLAQRPSPSISQSEKKAFYRLILQDYFQEGVDRNDKPAEVKLITGSVPAEFLPGLQSVKFSFVSKDEIDRFRHLDNGSEFEYYEVSGPEYRYGRWRFWVTWLSVSRCSSHDSDVEYEFRRVLGRWKFRKGRYGASVSEGGCWEPKPPPPAQRSPR